MKGNSELIHFSRAGDIFHYRWAAKRCLKLLDFNTDLQKLTIEGSLEPDKAGECVVDVAEYYESDKKDKSVDYFQLKHSTKQLNSPFTHSLLKDTITGFSKRFKALNSKGDDFKVVNFKIITNRPIAESFKTNVSKIAKNEKADSTFTKTIKNYTQLSDRQLRNFCSQLMLCDGEGNYDSQKYDIHKELLQITSSKDINNLTKLLVAKITEKIEPGKSNTVTVNDVLEVFDVTDIDDFFPAPPLFEPISDYIPRKQQDEIIDSIRNSTSHTVITANGGVGKSILCKHITNSFNNSSFVIAYDCFGNGGYRRTSQKRHRAVDAFVQISNQLAKEGLCDPLIPTRQEPDDFWMKAFLSRLKDASGKLKKKNNEAQLVILFDAVDNAEIAAEEASDTCFATLLIREDVPDNCRLVFTSRPERVHLFDPPSIINEVKLKPFTTNEAFINLRNHYPDASQRDANEFNRLTSCNPRVQANSFNLNIKSVSELLFSFGSQPVSVNDLIEKQLDQAILKLKDSFPKNYRNQIDSICTGLATLPPFVPLQVLAAVADVSIDTVKSFITELGRPLWMTDESVQFRDEPTEKWFQDNFVANVRQVAEYIEPLKPLAMQYSYISETLPILMLKAELFDDLVSLALSEEHLPKDRPFDARKIRLFRLQYAFKAALKEEKYFEAGKLALRAGEEIAGDNRQIEILSSNCDLASSFLSSDRIQELAHRKVIYGGWEGSETAYSSSLLSSIAECKGEARSYLRSAHHWLHRHIDKCDESKESEERFDDKLDNRDILELATANYNLFGKQKAVDYILSWSPQNCIFNVTEIFIRRLVDSGEFTAITEMALYGKANPSFILAVTNELMSVGKYPPKECLTRCLNQIIKPSKRLEKPDTLYNSSYGPGAYLSFLEACVINKLPSRNIIRALNYYIETPQLYSVADEHQYYGNRSLFLRTIGIRSALRKEFSLTVENILPKEWTSVGSSQKNYNELKRAKELLGKLLPWHMITAKILAGSKIDLVEEHKVAEKTCSAKSYSSYREYEPAPYEIARQRFKNIYLLSNNEDNEVQEFLKDINDDKVKLNLNDKIHIVRVCCRQPQLESLIDDIEISCNQSMQTYSVDDSPESYADQFISLSRAVLNVSPKDSGIYFDKAIEIVSNFGDEAVVRWEAVVSIAKKSAENNTSKPETAYRFMRCAELIGETVAREKHWDRNDALTTCFMLSPESAFAIANRWKERYVGWSDRQIIALANSAVDSNLIPSSALWCLSAFSWEHGIVKFCEKCIKSEPSHQKCQNIFNDLVNDFRIKDIRGKVWSQIDTLASQYGLSHPELVHIEQLSKSEKDNENYYLLSKQEKEEDYNWRELYGEFDITSHDGLKCALEKFKSPKDVRETEKFWSGCYAKLTSRNAASFLTLIREVEFLNFYDIQNVFEQFPSKWKEKPGILQAWNQAVEYIAQRFPYRFTNIYERRYLLESFDNSPSTLDAIQQGILKWFSESVDLESANALFGFAHYCTSLITVSQAEQLLDYGLYRFEMQIEDDFGDGAWCSALLPPNDLNKSLAGYIFANLGSPHNEERWRAVHAVIRLYKLGCKEQIKYLLEFMLSGDVDSFLPPNFLFYIMHAKLYLLAALSRCVIDDSSLLIDKSKVFSEIAINSNHVLIQLYAKNIALQIETSAQGSYDEYTLKQLNLICDSPYPPIVDNKYSYHTNSPWHEENTIDITRELWFGYDFDRYWFEPLGRVFGISGKQIQDLATEVVLSDWSLSFKDKYINDPRRELWKSHRTGRDTYYSHSNYPKTDNYEFYISYHAMNTVAAKLLHSMPVVNRPDYGEDSWQDWLKYHLLIGSENHLVSELRDVFPLKRRAWVSEKISDNWRWEISSDDFLEVLIDESRGDTWLNVKGSWNEYIDGHNENISISSILIPRELSNSFLNTITNFDNHMHENYLQNYCEDDFGRERKKCCFKGVNWLESEDSLYGIDDKDPYAGDVDPRPYAIVPEISLNFELSCCKLEKSWYLNGASQSCIVNELWSDDKPLDNDRYYRKGKKAKASLEFLMHLCKKLDIELALQVNIERTFVGHKKNRNDDDFGYIPRYSKTFILSRNGKLRDSRKSYQLRKEANIES